MMTSVAWLATLHEVLLATRARVGTETVTLDAGLAGAAALFRRVREHRGTVWWVGNGGSCAVCSHLSQDALNKLGLRTQLLSDPALMTCMANDFGYAEVYARPLRQMAGPDDLLVAISSSGNSPNILAAADVARSVGMGLLTLSAFDADNKLWSHESDVALYVDSHLYGMVEVGHEALLHAIIECLWLEEREKP